MRLLQLSAATGIHLTLVCHRPHLPAALHQALRTADYSVTADFEAVRRHYYGTPITEPSPADEPAGPTGSPITGRQPVRGTRAADSSGAARADRGPAVNRRGQPLR
jgi:hypothetical protein